MKVYVAGASAELSRAERAVAWVHDSGHQVEVDWPQAIAEQGSACPDDPDVRLGCASMDMGGVAMCDLFWLLVPRSQTKGAWWEAGAAMARGVTMVASGTVSDMESNIFLELVRYRFAHYVKDPNSHYVGLHVPYRDVARAQESADREALAFIRGRLV